MAYCETKKKIAILVSGQIRNSSLHLGDNTEFETSFKNNVLNQGNTNDYDLHVFFCVDKINTDRLKDLCGDHLKGVIQLDHENIKNPLNVEEIEKQYFEYYNNKRSNPEKYPMCTSTYPRSGMVYKMHKLYCAYQLMLEFEEKNNFEYDYILYLRPDNVILKDMNPYFHSFEKDGLILATGNMDWVFFGTREIMSQLCNLVKCYGKYNIGEIIHSEDYHTRIMGNYYEWAIKIAPENWSESPEVQCVEHLLDYLYKNNISSQKIYKLLEGVFDLVPSRK